jgi:hypothetical protein
LVPKNHLVGLHSINLVDRIQRRENPEDSLGVYVGQLSGESPHIEIAVQTLFEKMPQFYWFVPLVAKLMIARVLFHEIGHHVQFRQNRTRKRWEEKEAERFGATLARRAFPVLGLAARMLFGIIAPFAKVREYFNRVAK